jgi:hypothetical protein
MHGTRQRPDDISTGCIFVALVLGMIVTPFIKCGQVIGCVSEDFGKTKVMVNDEGRECYQPQYQCENTGYKWNGKYEERR